MQEQIKSQEWIEFKLWVHPFRVNVVELLILLQLLCLMFLVVAMVAASPRIQRRSSEPFSSPRHFDMPEISLKKRFILKTHSERRIKPDVVRKIMDYAKFWGKTLKIGPLDPFQFFSKSNDIVLMKFPIVLNSELLFFIYG